MKNQDSAAKIATLHTGGSRCCATESADGDGTPSLPAGGSRCCATATKMAAPHNGEVINRRGSYQQAPAPSQKKAEGKRGIPPLTPYGEMGRVKKQDGGSFGTLQDRAGAHAHARRLPCSCSYAEAGEAVLEIIDNCFGSFKKDCRLWAWYCRHFDRRRIVDKAYYYASCQRCGEVKSAVSAFQSWLRQEFGTKGGAA